MRSVVGGCARVKWVTQRFSMNFTFRKCDGNNTGEAVKQVEKLCDEMETVQDFTHIGDRMSSGGGCEAAVTAIT